MNHLEEIANDLVAEILNLTHRLQAIVGELGSSMVIQGENGKVFITLKDKKITFRMELDDENKNENSQRHIPDTI